MLFAFLRSESRRMGMSKISRPRFPSLVNEGEKYVTSILTAFILIT